MHRQLKIMALANVLPSLFFVLANLVVWLGVESWLNTGSEGLYVVTDVSPLWIQMDITQPLPVMSNAHIDIPNYPFYVFWVAIAVNLFFVIRLGRSKETS